MISQDTYITLLYEILIASFLGTIFTIITQGLSRHTKKGLMFLNFFFTSILIISLCYIRFNVIFNIFFANFNMHWQEYKVFIYNAVTSLTTTYEQLKGNDWLLTTLIPAYIDLQFFFTCISIYKIISFNKKTTSSHNIFYIIKITLGILFVYFIFTCFYTIFMFIVFNLSTYEDVTYIQISAFSSIILSLLTSVVICEYNKFINGY
jgi:hypothetical protein